MDIALFRQKTTELSDIFHLSYELTCRFGERKHPQNGKRKKETGNLQSQKTVSDATNHHQEKVHKNYILPDI